MLLINRKYVALHPSIVMQPSTEKLPKRKPGLFETQQVFVYFSYPLRKVEIADGVPGRLIWHIPITIIHPGGCYALIFR
jgi:hypothetical protein